MSDTVRIKAVLESREVKALMRKLSGPKLFQALSVAVNDSARQVERKAEFAVAKSLSIPVKRARQGIWISPYSSAKTLTAVVRGSSSEIPLKAFGAREEGSGVVAKIWGAKVSHPGAFIFGGAPGNRKELSLGGHVFHRVGSSRLPIKKAKGAAISEAMAKDAISRVNEEYGAQRLQANVMRQLDRYTRSRAPRSSR